MKAQTQAVRTVLCAVLAHSALGAQLATFTAKEYDSRMNFARAILASLIILMMSMSSWANTSMACKSADSESASLADNSMAMADHAHHGATSHGTEQAGSGIAGGDSAPTNSPSKQVNDHNADCPCCGGCLSLCAVSGSGTAAITGSAIDFSYLQAETFNLALTSFHASPPSPPLFRPPSTKTS